MELAATRLGALGLAPLAAAIGNGLQLLSAGHRGAPERQRTLRGALEWTHGLLTAEQQTVFRRLGVFATRFGLASAQRVVADGPNASDEPVDAAVIADAVAALVDCSLLKRDDAESPRFGMLQSTRLFARECLGQGAEARAVRLRQLDHYTARRREAFEGAAADRAAHERGAAEYSNIRGALEWAFAAGGDTPAGTALALALLPFWQFALEGDESGRWIELSKAHTDATGSTTPVAATAADGDAERTVALLMQRLQAEGVIGGAEVAGIERAALLSLARRLRPGELRDVDAAYKGLQHAVEIASRLIAPRTASPAPAPGPGATALVDAALAQVADHTRAGDFDHGVDAIDTALAGLADHRRRSLEAIVDAERALLAAAVEHELLRRDAFAVARRVEAVARGHRDLPFGAVAHPAVTVARDPGGAAERPRRGVAPARHAHRRPGRLRSRRRRLPRSSRRAPPRRVAARVGRNPACARHDAAQPGRPRPTARRRSKPRCRR